MSVKAIQFGGRAVVRVTLSRPYRSVDLAGIDRPVSNINAATKFVENMDEETAERGQTLLMETIGDFMRQLDDALNASINEINVKALRDSLKTAKRKPDQR